MAQSRSTNTPSVIIEDLVRRAAAGDRDAQQALLVRYRYFIHRAVRARMGPLLDRRESPSDLEQDVAIDLLHSLSSVAWRGRSAFLAWLKHLVADGIIDAARYHSAARRSPQCETSLSDVAGPLGLTSAESWIDEQRRLTALEAMLDKLPDAQAHAVVLHYQGHTYGEIAEVLDTTAEAARKLVARGRAKLASWMRGSTVLG